MVNIAVQAQDLTVVPQAQQLAEQLQLDLITTPSSHYQYILLVTPAHLEIQKQSDTSIGPLVIDFLQGATGFRFKNKIEKELLTRAIGMRKDKITSVIDVTAGLGRDGFLLALAGCEVLLLERNPLISVLLADALQRALKEQRFANLEIKLFNTDAKQFLAQLTPLQFPDVIYLDPMFPERSKTALVKKEMRYLQELAGKDEDAAELFALALTKARHRVVVKRPRLAPAFAKPSFVLMGKAMRFDVYVNTSESHF